jgi:Transposase
LNIFCGIDWAEDHHDVAVIDADGQLVIKRRITDDADGFAELLGMLESVGDTSNDPIPLAIETPRGVLVSALLGISSFSPMNLTVDEPVSLGSTRRRFRRCGVRTTERR